LTEPRQRSHAARKTGNGHPSARRYIWKRRAAYKVPGGHLVIREFILNEERTAPPFAAIFAINMLVGTEHGNAYTEGEYRTWMTEAGLDAIVRPDPQGDVLVAQKL
jgi:hypothetical protein